jgi:hypothetical protein
LLEIAFTHASFLDKNSSNKITYWYFLKKKIIFDISTLKWSKNTKNY